METTTRHISRYILKIAAVGAIVLAILAVPVFHGSQAATTGVTGPIAVTPTSTPFMMDPGDLAADGYVEQEFFISGTANVYQFDGGGNVVVKTPNVPYTTRILVRRPVPIQSASAATWS